MSDKKLFKVIDLSVLKYVLTGIISWLADNALFSILKLIFKNRTLFSVGIFSKTFDFTTLMLFTVISMATGFFVSFLLNRFWTFRSRGVVRVQLIKCIVLLGFNTVVTAAVVHLASFSSVQVLPDIVKYSMSVVTGIWNYFVYKFWVYK